MVRNVVKITKTGKGSAANTSPSRGDYGVSKVNRRLRPAGNGSSVQNRGTAGHAERLRQARTEQVKEVAGKAVNIANAATATWVIIGATWIFYLIQFVFSALYTIAMGGMLAYEGSLAETLDLFGWGSDAGVGIMLFFMGVVFAMWLCTLMVAMVIFYFRGVEMMPRASLVILILTMVLSVAPVASLIPWVWVWCAYVVKAQADQ